MAVREGAPFGHMWPIRARWPIGATPAPGSAPPVCPAYSRTTCPASARAALTCADRQLAEVEDARGQHRVGAGGDRRGEVRELAGAARWR